MTGRGRRMLPVLLACLVVAMGPPILATGPAEAAGPNGDATAGVAPAPAAAPERYLDHVFDSVRVTKDITYSRQLNVDGWEDLRLDLYEPVGDTSRQRPVIVYAHGGGFAEGDKATGNGVEMGRELAERGFVVASINYRLDPGNGWGTYDDIGEALANDRFFASVMRATNDVGFAVRYLRQHASTYRLHPEAIVTSGYSAGAVAALTKAYLPVHSDTVDTHTAAVASLAGMSYAWYAEPGEPPAIMFHGTADSTVPFGSAQTFCSDLAPKTGCTMVSFAGQGHGIAPDWEPIREQMSAFFYDQVLEPLGFTTEINPLDGASTFHTTPPTRLVDTRIGLGAPAARLGPGAALTIDPTGSGTVPAVGVDGIIANITVTNGSAASHLTVWPAGEAMPTASSLNWVTGTTRANLVTVKTGAGGAVSIANNAGTVDVVVDVVGWLGPDDLGDRLHTVTPTRVVDTRAGLGGPAAALGPGATRTIDPTGSAGVPATGATAVIANVTVTGGTAASHLTVWPGGTPPVASNLNWAPGQTVPNQVIAELEADGTFSVRNNSGSTDLIIDVVAWLGPAPIGGRGCTLISPTRLLDTRSGVGGPATPLGSGAARQLQVAGVAGIPASGVGAVFTNMTVTGGTAASHLTVWPAGTTMPTVSSLNWQAGETAPNHVVAPLGDDGAISLANHAGATEAVVDVTAWC